AARHLESRRLICRITALNNGKFYSRHRVIALVLRQQMNKEVLCSYSVGASDQFGRRRTNLASARKFITPHPALRQIPGIDLIPPFWRHTWLGQHASTAHREGDTSPCRASAMPILVEHSIHCSSIPKGSAIASIIFPATVTATWESWGSCSNRITNSSPARRATKSDWRTSFFKRCAN